MPHLPDRCGHLCGRHAGAHLADGVTGKSSIAHKGLLYAGKVLAAAAIDLLDDPELVKKEPKSLREKRDQTDISRCFPRMQSPGN